MKINSTPVIWAVFFFASFFVLAYIAYSYIEPREILVSKSQAKIIGLKIGKNEGVSNRVNMLDWRDGDRFSSLGIAHFVWYPTDVNKSQLSFNGLLAHLSKSQVLPDWLINVKYPPWNSKEDFLLSKHNAFKSQLSYFLQENISGQTIYLISYLESILPVMLKEIKSPFAKMHTYENFYHISMQENGVYTLVDYFVFQGDGTSPKNRYNNQGWGLLQVLEYMKGDSDNLLQEFVSSADILLGRRITNAPSDESKFLLRWRQRLNTYI